MKANILLTLLLFPMLALANPIFNKAFVGGIKQDAKWSGHSNVLIQCLRSSKPHENFNDCVLTKMRKNKVNEQTIAFFEATSGLIEKIKNYGPVAAVEAQVVAADHARDFYLVSKKGQIIQTSDYKRLQEALTKANNPEYQKLKAEHPRAMVWSIAVAMPKTKKLPDDVGQFIFTYQIKDGCNACAILGDVEMGYNFAKTGKFLGVELVGVKQKK